MVHGCMVYTERAHTAAVSCGISYASAVTIQTTLVDIQKRTMKKLVTHVLRITCERRESARERRTVLYKSNHHHHQ